MTQERPGVTAFIALVLAVSLVPVSLFAEPRHGRGQYLIAQNQEPRAITISRDEAAAIARGATGGRVLSVELKGGKTYRVKVLLNDERVRTLRIDARTGALQD